ncbi:MAG TPA: hypothetical protein VII38_06790 [Polyangia bacterium]|jgi:hypothetical protein
MSTKPIALSVALLLGAGCSHPAMRAPDAAIERSPASAHAPAPAPGDRATTTTMVGDLGPIEILPVRFEELFPIFLLRHSMPLGEKAALWQEHYYGKWVRWSGKLISFTPNGITVLELKTTLTFDVSLWVEADQFPTLREKLRVGDRVTYIGKLDSYDDVFRKLYLTHGAIIEPPDARTDGGH